MGEEMGAYRALAGYHDNPCLGGIKYRAIYGKDTCKYRIKDSLPRIRRKSSFYNRQSSHLGLYAR